MPIKIDSTNGSITLTAEDGSGNAGLTIPRAGYLSADGNGANLTNVLTLSGGAMTGAITTNSTFDGVDIATRDAVLTSTTTTANGALAKTGGAMTGAITTNSTFDGVDIATRDGVLSTTVTTANAALARSGGTMSGGLAMGANTITSTGKILFSNMYAAVSDLPSASTYHGMFAHVHATGKGYFAHGGAWIELANQTDLSTATTTAGAALSKAGGAMTGAITTNSTFDGRDVATDGTKLDGIETSATADQTATQIKTHLQDGIDSIHYVDGSIDTEHIADDAVTADKLANSLNTAIASAATTGKAIAMAIVFG